MPEPDLTALVARVTEATSALIGGDIRRYLELVDHADDFTLMGPTGGDTVRGSDRSDEAIAGMAAFFKRGEATLEVVETYTSGDLAVLVVVEHQQGEVGDRPSQDWSLRVTLVFRHEGSRWRLVHRHADALVRPITFDQLASLARGPA
jgi:ketosteroid isomerase-like protein